MIQFEAAMWSIMGRIVLERNTRLFGISSFMQMANNLGQFYLLGILEFTFVYLGGVAEQVEIGLKCI